MKCVKQGLLVVLLGFLLVSPAFCGWDAFKRSSYDSLTQPSDISVEEMREDAHKEALPEISPAEEEIESKPIEENSVNYEENSENYEGLLEETKEALEEAKVEVADEKPKKQKPVEEAIAKVDELIASKEALDENYNILADLALRQEKEIKHLKRQDVFKMGIGPAVGYKYMETIPVGFDLGFLFNEDWAIDVIGTYDVHATGGLHQFKEFTPDKIGVLVTVKKYF